MIEKENKEFFRLEWLLIHDEHIVFDIYLNATASGTQYNKTYIHKPWPILIVDEHWSGMALTAKNQA